MQCRYPAPINDELILARRSFRLSIPDPTQGRSPCHSSSVEVREISSSAHFLFYDNPVETFQAVGEFVHAN